MDSKDVLAAAMRGSWLAFVEAMQNKQDDQDPDSIPWDGLPLIEKLHAAHVTGFTGGLITGGAPILAVMEVSKAEMGRIVGEGE